MKKVVIASILSLAAVSAFANCGNGNDGLNGQGCQGEPGPAGPAGPMGPQGPQGIQGETGAAGKDGANGKDGAPGAAGINGKDGLNGAAGKDAVLPTNLLTTKDMSAMQVKYGQSIQDLQNQVDRNRRDANGGTASGMAVASLPQPYRPGASMIAAGVATWQGQQGIALGVSHATQNSKWVMKGAVTTSTRGGMGAAVAAGYQF